MACSLYRLSYKQTSHPPKSNVAVQDHVSVQPQLFRCEQTTVQDHVQAQTCFCTNLVSTFISCCQGYSRVIKVIQFLPVYIIIITR